MDIKKILFKTNEIDVERALPDAIVFCNKEGKCYHSLGFAKPFGYGKMKVVNVDLTTDKKVDKQKLHQAYAEKICQMCGFLNESSMLSSINKLFVLASPVSDKEIRYPSMQGKEFNSIKKSKMSINQLSPKK